MEVVLALPSVRFRRLLQVKPGCTVREAVHQAVKAGLLPPGVSVDVDPAVAPLGIYGEKVDDSHVCQPGDRVEIYRPLPQDPMQLRRQRARQSIS